MSPGESHPSANGLAANSYLVSSSLLSIGSVVLAEITLTQIPGPASGPEAVLLRTMPLQLLALILTAWQYGWSAVIAFAIGIPLFSIGLYSWLTDPGRPVLPPITVVLIEAVSFLVVGYFISSLIQRLKEQQIALALANSRLVQHAATLEELTISRERNRMARELHDTVAHTQSALSMQLETVKAYIDVDSETAKKMLEGAIEANRAGLQETRDALEVASRQSDLDDLGLELALRRLAEQTATRANARLDLSLPSAPLSLPSETEQAIYRIAQEALNNAGQHANASAISLAVETTDSNRIVDNTR